MKYYLIAGESSGDLYGGKIINELSQLDTNAVFQYWGGHQMLAQSEGRRKSLKETAFMGFWEVAKNIFSIKALFDFAKKDILEFNPDILILIDYPGFNLRISEWAHKKGISVAYYISPQLWAWKEKRHQILKRSVDLFFVILPFETEFYRNLDTPCIYYGHPLLELIPDTPAHKVETHTIGLFPGSRLQEINKHLPLMSRFAERHPDKKFIISAVEHIEKKHYLKHLKKYLENLDIKYGSPYKLMKNIDIAIASSGTVTLELALHNIPQIVIYKTSAISFTIGKMLVTTPYISLVNLIAGKKVVPELLQDECHIDSLETALDELQENGRQQIINAYAEIRKSLGEGNTSLKVAKHIYEYLLEKQQAAN